ncbi:hypothetical protein NDU88_006400 [Pleurodeles waltl]|uniref:Uncharacterized protein n=1 Tax=Pleurodeles waltl TaxID=8319 RepID=A0AAV7QHW9_PLEWA|nr:hypothetical protein NDU88_006400 [Pleurodeles waltl]
MGGVTAFFATVSDRLTAASGEQCRQCFPHGPPSRFCRPHPVCAPLAPLHPPFWGPGPRNYHLGSALHAPLLLVFGERGRCVGSRSMPSGLLFSGDPCQSSSPELPTPWVSSHAPQKVAYLTMTEASFDSWLGHSCLALEGNKEKPPVLEVQRLQYSDVE